MGLKPLKLIVVLMLVGLSFQFLRLPAYAHTLAKDGKISAFLHIDPDDKPVPGKINTVHFYFNDQDFRFSMEGCFCDANVSEGKKILYKGVLPASDLRVGKINVLLPDNNFSYDVVVSGAPKADGYFQPFKLKFNIDVGNPPPEATSKHNYWLPAVLAAVIAGAGLAVFYALALRRNR
jgi:hypothetical protein